jgi:hypothetical protein
MVLAPEKPPKEKPLPAPPPPPGTGGNGKPPLRIHLP